MIIHQESEHDGDQLITWGHVETDDMYIDFRIENGDMRVFDYTDENYGCTIDSINWQYPVNINGEVKTLMQIYDTILDEAESEQEFLDGVNMANELRSPQFTGRV